MSPRLPTLLPTPQAYPPFVLRAAGLSGDDGDGGQGHFYDGQLLAMYMVSRGVFQCPITRRKLTLRVGPQLYHLTDPPHLRRILLSPTPALSAVASRS